MGIGYDDRALIFAAGLAVLAGAYYWTNVSHALLFWAAFTLSRPLGATLGDFLGRPIQRGWVGFELPDRLRGNCGLHHRVHSFAAAAARRIRSEHHMLMTRCGESHTNCSPDSEGRQLPPCSNRCFGLEFGPSRSIGRRCLTRKRRYSARLAPNSIVRVPISCASSWPCVT